ncbi:holin [Streptomyces flavidovirens]|uniref:holin n=1 Tax=Streptomyces flavidovirens TaxID=67298 RepID=UPI000409B6B4|nr:holin [Streptomyces flavidovirens]
MTTAAFWKATAERMVRTFAQAVLGVISADGLGLLDVEWVAALSVGGLAAVLALLTAIVTSGGTVGPGITETVAAPTTPRGPTSI